MPTGETEVGRGRLAGRGCGTGGGLGRRRLGSQGREHAGPGEPRCQDPGQLGRPQTPVLTPQARAPALVPVSVRGILAVSVSLTEANKNIESKSGLGGRERKVVTLVSTPGPGARPVPTLTPSAPRRSGPLLRPLPGTEGPHPGAACPTPLSDALSPPGRPGAGGGSPSKPPSQEGSLLSHRGSTSSSPGPSRPLRPPGPTLRCPHHSQGPGLRAWCEWAASRGLGAGQALGWAAVVGVPLGSFRPEAPS